MAAYEEPEIARTIVNAINKSSGKNELIFGVHACFKDISKANIPNFPNVKTVHSVAPENIGLGKGRRLAHELYDGEDYYFQIDSHSRFKQNWDEFLINEMFRFKSLGIEKPLITGYPAPYRYENDVETYDQVDFVHSIDFTFEKDMFKNYRYPKQTQVINKDRNIFSYSVSGGCIFTEGPSVIPNDNILFMGEEIVIAAMAYTRGFDLVIPQMPFMYHLYFYEEMPDYAKRGLVWRDWPEEYQALNEKHHEEIKSMFMENKIGPHHLGDVRSLKEFEAFTGLNFTTGEVTLPCV